MSVALRPARSTDAGATGEIMWAFSHDTPWMPELHTGAETISFCGQMIDRGWVTIAEADGQITGFIARNGDDVIALHVRSGMTGQGIGQHLLEDAKRRSDRLRLWTFQANTGAQAFYLREGFAEVARTDGAGNDENLPDISYLWTKEAQT